MNKTKSTESPSPISFEMDLAEAVRIAQGMIAGLGLDDYMPLITQSHWTIHNGELTALATDRYRVHRMRVAVDCKTDGEVLVPADVLKWIVRHRVFYKRNSRRPNDQLKIGFTFKPQPLPEGHTQPTTPRWLPIFAITLLIQNSDTEAVSLTAPSFSGSFPPVGKLVEDAIAAPAISVETISLQPEFIIGTRALAGASRLAPLIKFTAGSRLDKPGPALITYGDDAAALIQPNLLTR